MEAVGFEMVEVYITRGHNTVAQYIVTRKILEICVETERRERSHVTNWWSEQGGVNLTGVQAATEV